MLAFVDLSGISVTDIIVLVGVLGYVVDRAMDAKGWSRSSKTLRRENQDLIRRNSELDAIVSRLETDLASQRERVARLQVEIEELKKRDVSALYHLMETHERRAEERHGKTCSVLEAIANRLDERST